MVDDVDAFDVEDDEHVSDGDDDEARHRWLMSLLSKSCLSASRRKERSSPAATECSFRREGKDLALSFASISEVERLAQEKQEKAKKQSKGASAKGEDGVLAPSPA